MFFLRHGLSKSVENVNAVDFSFLPGIDLL